MSRQHQHAFMVIAKQIQTYKQTCCPKQQQVHQPQCIYKVIKALSANFMEAIMRQSGSFGLKCGRKADISDAGGIHREWHLRQSEASDGPVLDLYAPPQGVLICPPSQP